MQRIVPGLAPTTGCSERVGVAPAWSPTRQIDSPYVRRSSSSAGPDMTR